MHSHPEFTCSTLEVSPQRIPIWRDTRRQQRANPPQTQQNAPISMDSLMLFQIISEAFVLPGRDSMRNAREGRKSVSSVKVIFESIRFCRATPPSHRRLGSRHVWAIGLSSSGSHCIGRLESDCSAHFHLLSLRQGRPERPISRCANEPTQAIRNCIALQMVSSFFAVRW